MTDNRTTELLCKLLEEHGIAWKKRRGYIRWSKQTKYGVTHYQAWPCLDGTITLTVRDEYGLTPEQAIAATLGEACEGCYLICDGKKFPVELDYGFTGLTPMPFAITVSGFRYSLEVPE